MARKIGDMPAIEAVELFTNGHTIEPCPCVEQINGIAMRGSTPAEIRSELADLLEFATEGAGFTFVGTRHASETTGWLTSKTTSEYESRIYRCSNCGREFESISQEKYAELVSGESKNADDAGTPVPGDGRSGGSVPRGIVGGPLQSLKRWLHEKVGVGNVKSGDS